MGNSTEPTKTFDETCLTSGSADYLEDLYSQYSSSSDEISPEWQNAFSKFEQGIPVAKELATDSKTTAAVEDEIRKQAAVQRLVRNYQVNGHRNAFLDPLILEDKQRLDVLKIESVGLTDKDLDLDFKFDAVTEIETAPLRTILEFYENIYCKSIGYEFMYIDDSERIRWLQDRIENSALRPEITDSDRKEILKLLTMAEGMETYLHTKYVGQKRFSLEGGESLIPLLRETILLSGAAGAQEIVIGMAHRGRLNVLVNILGKSPSDLFGEFEGKEVSADSARMNEQGDVKYHQGFSSDISTPGGSVHVAMAFNPSHLEIINPVVQGSVRARQQRRRDVDRLQVVPIVVHGDAAFAGQGVVMETFNMSHTRGFRTGGTLHVIVNNQIGFTTSNKTDARSTGYCTAVAKMIQAPIFHVNGDDPEAVVFVARLAHAYRMKFHTDVVIDMVCYRRHGHNEADEPTMTQPIMYSKVKQLVPIRRKYAAQLVEQDVVSEEDAQRMVNEYRDSLDRGEVVAGQVFDLEKAKKMTDWTPYLDTKWHTAVDTSVAIKKFAELDEKMQPLPEGFKVHPRVQKIREDRTKMSKGELPCDWGFAEMMAYATLIDQDYSIRLTGQDSGRGTFSHRHAVLHDQSRVRHYNPLCNLRGDYFCEVIDSLLSEEAVLGFEYGYSTTDPNAFVIWEAQFGDFANGAQIVIDQFISSGESKWARLCGLTLLLPHGYEGQGPEHSSARPERFLQLCAGDNMQVCVPTLPSQIFHLLRRQVLRQYRHPLVIMSPKSLLRHKRAVSSLDDLANGKFLNIIDETEDSIDRDFVVRVVLCSGKLYFEMLEMRNHLNIDNIAIVRIEQLHPFPSKDLRNILKKYPYAEEIVWCQEEPENQGAWYQIWHALRSCLPPGRRLKVTSREAAASPSVGNYRVHLTQQDQLIHEALTADKSIVSFSDHQGKKAYAS